MNKPTATNKEIEAICQSLGWLNFDHAQKFAVRDAIELAYAAGAAKAKTECHNGN